MQSESHLSHNYSYTHVCMYTPCTHTHTVPCDQIVTPDNGNAYFSITNDMGVRSGGSNNSTIRLSPGDAARFSCDRGFSLVSLSTVVCQTNGKWSAPPPTCAVGKWRYLEGGGRVGVVV